MALTYCPYFGNGMADLAPVLRFGVKHSCGVPPEHWTNGMLGFPPTEENQDEEEKIYR